VSRGPASSPPISEDAILWANAGASWRGGALAGCGCETKCTFIRENRMQLTSEMRYRPRYYDLVSASLRKGRPLLTNAAVTEPIRSTQRELLRPPVEARRTSATAQPLIEIVRSIRLSGSRRQNCAPRHRVLCGRS
jgi:hypothetical protein